MLALKVIIFIFRTQGILPVKLFFANTVIPLPLATSPDPQNIEIKNKEINAPYNNATPSKNHSNPSDAPNLTIR